MEEFTTIEAVLESFGDDFAAKTDTLIAHLEARGFRTSHNGAEMIASLSDEVLRGVMAEAIVDAATRLDSGNPFEFMRTTYGVALMTREAIKRGLIK